MLYLARSLRPPEYAVLPVVEPSPHVIQRFNISSTRQNVLPVFIHEATVLRSMCLTTLDCIEQI